MLNASYKMLLVIPLIWWSLSAAQAHEECSSRELKQKSCILKSKDLKITLGPGKITWLHDSWRGIHDFPDSKTVASWEAARIFNLDSREFLEIKVWRTSPAELTVETLNWLLLELHHKELKIHFEKQIGKRKPAEEVKEKFISDQVLKTKVVMSKEKGQEKTIIWSTDQESGSLSDGI